MKLIKLDLLDGLAKPYISVRAEDFERIARYLRDANNAIEQQPASTSAQVPEDVASKIADGLWKKLCAIQRNSFFLNESGNGVIRVPGYSGTWVPVHAIQEMLDVQVIDAMLNQPQEG